MKAYHFCSDTLRDGRPIPADGEWLIHEGYVTICESGLHASAHPFDALQYAPGPILCLVECEDVVVEQDDKFVCCRRKIIARFDATDMLRAFARQCALDVIHLWDAPAVVREYLETGDKSLRGAAMDAAWGAAWGAASGAASGAARGAAMDAAWGAASGAARGAAMDAAWGAASGAARSAARAVAWDAAGAAAWDAAGTAAWDAARAAAWAAAEDAAGDAQKAKFAEMVNAKFKEMGHA